MRNKLVTQTGLFGVSRGGGGGTRRFPTWKPARSPRLLGSNISGRARLKDYSTRVPQSAWACASLSGS